MEPRIELLQEKKFIGKRTVMSFVNITTKALWQGFMPRRNEITNKIGTELYSFEVYPPGFFEPYNPEAKFEKWAAVEVMDFDTVPFEMEMLVVPAGQYAVFIHKGPASEAARTYDYIFRTWLPASDFLLDNRPHFAIMGAKYKRDDPGSEEEVWIPVIPKKPAGTTFSKPNSSNVL
jgi:AraC family transcriptional regulator